MKYVFHLGVHKTASTLLQQNLSNNLEVLRAQGVYYVNAEYPRAIQRQRKVMRALRDPSRETPPKDALAGTNAAIMNAAAAQGARIVLLSEDNQLGASMNHELSWRVQNPSFYPEAASCFRHATHGLPLDNAQILLFSRDPASYLVALYSDAVRLAQTTRTLEDFCRSVNFNSINFEGLEATLRTVHPTMPIRMRQFERIKLGAETYIRTFLRDIGLDPKPFRLTTKRTQTQLDAIQVEALLHIMAGSETKRWRLIKRLREQVLNGAPNPEARLILPEWVTESLRVSAEGRASDAA